VNGESPMPPGRVPTLTEVVAWPEAALSPDAAPNEVAAPAPSEPSAAAAPPAPGAPITPAESIAATASAASAASAVAPAEPSTPPQLALLESQLNERVLADVQRQIDLMLDYRLREVLTPLLSRVADNLVRDVRIELASTLREVVSRAVAQELARHRIR
jgi:hypothetical protein